MPLSTQTVDTERPLHNQEVLFRRINEILEPLKAGVQVLVAKSGLATGRDAISDRADDILQATLETAVKIADRYDLSQNAYSWLMGIATIKIKEARRLQAVEYKRERLIVETYGSEIDDNSKSLGLSEDEQLEILLIKTADRSRLDEILPGVEDILALIKEPERSLLRMAYVDEMSGKEIGQMLNVSEAAALMRVSRARQLLFLAYQNNEMKGAK